MYDDTIDIFGLMFQYEVLPVYQFAGDLYDSLVSVHSLALFRIKQVHRRVLTYRHPCRFYQVTVHNGVFS